MFRGLGPAEDADGDSADVAHTRALLAERLVSLAEAGDYVALSEALRTHGAVADATDADEDSPLICAALGGREQCVRVLLAHGATATLQGCSQRSAAHAAAFAGHRGTLALLLAARGGARLAGMTDALYDRPLHKAAVNGHAACVELLLAQPGAADAVAAPNVLGSTPLHCAAQHGHAGVCRRLLAAGADPHALDVFELTALHAALYGGHRATVHVLADAMGLTPADVERLARLPA